MEKKRSRCKKGTRWNKSANECKEYILKKSSTRKKTPDMRISQNERIDLQALLTSNKTLHETIVEKLDQLPTKKEIQFYLNILNQASHRAFDQLPTKKELQSYLNILNQASASHVVSPEVLFVEKNTSKMNEMTNPMRNPMRTQGTNASTKRLGSKEIAKFKNFSRVNRNAILGNKTAKSRSIVTQSAEPHLDLLFAPTKMNDMTNPMRTQNKKASAQKLGSKEIAKFMKFSRVNRHAVLGKKNQ
jgi:hypothetical protein